MSMNPLTIDEIEAAAHRIAPVAMRTPLIEVDAGLPGCRVLLKLEPLQPVGSFKIRGAANLMLSADPRDLAAGVYTPSAGNMGQAVAWNARRLGIRSSVIVPDHAPAAKIDAIRRFGGEVVMVPFERWWEVVQTRSFPGQEGRFVHPFADAAVMAGNGTIGLEILQDAPEVDTVIVPFGGGGLACGIAAAIAARRPSARVLAAEVETSAAFSAALQAGEPVPIEYTPSFVDGIGSSRVSDEMWPLVKESLAGSIVSTLDEVADAMGRIARSTHVIAEGAGASSLAAALSGRAGTGTIVCVVSGGNIDLPVFLEHITRTAPERTPT